MSDYRVYRRDHPGPLSQKSFEFWKRNGGNDLKSFKWKKEKEIKKNDKKKNTKNHQQQKKIYKIYKNEIKNMNGHVHYH